MPIPSCRPLFRAFLAALVLSGAAALPALAQDADVIPAAAVSGASAELPAPASPAALAGPFADQATVAVRGTDAALNADEAAAALYQQRSGLRRSQALMLIGATAVVAGIIVGDDAGTVLVIGGAVIGLYGLFLAVQ